MELLKGLGVNGTIGIQFAIFVVSYLVLYFVLFKPYFKAYTERQNRTMGRAEAAERYIAEAHALRADYEIKARDLSLQFKSIYDRSRAEAMREYDRLVGEARAQAKSILEAAKSKIHGELLKARTDLQSEIPVVGKVITTQLLGKEISQ